MQEKTYTHKIIWIILILYSQIMNLKNESLKMAKIAVVSVIMMFAIQGQALSQPTNDNFADAIVLTGLSGRTTGSNADATKEAGEPDHAGNIGGEIGMVGMDSTGNRRFLL